MILDVVTAPACRFMPFIDTAQARAADTVRSSWHFHKLVQWIREEFEAAPDLRLTTREAAAFLGLDLDTCDRVLSRLLTVGALTRGPDGRFSSADPLVTASDLLPPEHGQPDAAQRRRPFGHDGLREERRVR